MPQVLSLLRAHEVMAAQPQRDTTAELSALILQSQNTLADILTRNFTGEIANQAKAIIVTEMRDLEMRLRDALKPPSMEELQAYIEERVRQHISEAISAIEWPEPEEDDDEEEEAPKTVSVTRKDGVIVGVSVGDTKYDVVRNKQGLIKEVKPRAN